MNVIQIFSYVSETGAKFQKRKCSWAITKQEKRAIRFHEAFSKNVKLIMTINENLEQKQAELLGGTR